MVEIPVSLICSGKDEDKDRRADESLVQYLKRAAEASRSARIEKTWRGKKLDGEEKRWPRVCCKPAIESQKKQVEGGETWKEEEK
jgi:hypothetical protein